MTDETTIPPRDDAEPNLERQAELRRAYAANRKARKAPYEDVKIETAGELHWITREPTWGHSRLLNVLGCLSLFGVSSLLGLFGLLLYLVLMIGFLGFLASGALIGFLVLFRLGTLVTLDVSGTLVTLATFLLGYVDLRKVNLQGINLQGLRAIGVWRDANVSGAHLEGADLSNKLATHVVLCDAHLEGADFTGAVLLGADLSGAHLQNTNLSGATLSGAKLDSVQIIKQVIIDSRTRSTRSRGRIPHASAMKAGSVPESVPPHIVMRAACTVRSDSHSASKGCPLKRLSTAGWSSQQSAKLTFGGGTSCPG